MEDRPHILIDIHTHRTGNCPCAIVNYPFECPFHPAKGQYYSTGIHPWSLKAPMPEPAWQRLEEQCADCRMLAVGEAGIDKLAKAPLPLQIEAFKRQAQIAERHERPLIVHCVRAMEELLAVRRELRPRQPWVWHGFRGKAQQAAQLLKAGFFLSFGERYAEDALAMMPPERLFLETDESRLPIGDILQNAACVRSIPAEELQKIVRKNIQNVFFKPRKPSGCR